MGFDTFLPPPQVERVYFEYLIRYDAERHGMPIELLVEALVAEGCEAESPRYPLLHQQPFFTEGHFAKVARIEGLKDIDLPTYSPDALPKTEAISGELLKLPCFHSADRGLLDQYVRAFEKVVSHASKIVEHCNRRVLP